MATINAQKQFIQAIDDLVSPIEIALQSDTNTYLFFKSLGWDFQRIDGFPTTSLVSALNNVYTSLLTVRNLINNPPQSLADFVAVLDVFKNLFDSIAAITTFINSVSAAGVTTAFKNEFTKLGTDIINHLVCGYLEARHFKVYAVLSVLGIITPYQVTGLTLPQSNVNEPWVRLPHYKSTIHLQNFVSLISNPGAYFKNQYYPASGTLTTAADAQEFSDKFFPRLALLLQSLGFDTYYGIDNATASQYPANAASVMKRTMTAVHHASDFLDYGATFSVSPTNEGGHGIVIGLFGDWTYNREIADWLLIMQASGSIDVFAINDNGIQFPTSTNVIAFDVVIQLLRLSEDNALAGSTTGTRFNIGEIAAIAGVGYEMNKVSYGFDLFFRKVTFAIGGEGDGFINKIIPNGAEGKFDLQIGWNSTAGFHINAGGGLEFKFPLHQKVGPIDFQGVTLGLYVQNASLSLRAGGDISLSVGSLIATVTNIGLKADLTFPATGGNLGVGNLAVKFKNPTGIGLSINAEQVKGSGFLNFDEATATYTGGLELKFTKIALKAIGILTTKMPDGSNGYSLLIIITAEFTPIQLGMGFTLNGVGGLLGLHRTMNTERLRSGVKDKTLDSILFPKNIVKNANAIISNINQVFPVKKDRFLIGPMAKIGWGTPTLLTIDLGVIIEVPSPVVLAIVGVLRAILPNESSPVLKLQINFVGIIDFDKKYLSFDASLYDSSILTFPLTGDMALRLYWGDKPNFLMSVGGFHPKFTPPPMNLPQLQRLAIQLANSSNLNIRVETYFAVTSNTAQFGARVSAKAKAWKIEAIGALWFDVLFQFSPFHFIADMGVMFEVRKGGSCLLSLYIDVTLEGPHPWRVQGEGSFKILFVRVNVSFDKTFGEAKTETIAPASIQQLMHDAILNKDNWQVIGPERSHQVVAFRDVTATTIGDLVVDPFGALTFSQKIAPLSIKLVKFGTTAISDINQFNITGVTAGPTGNTVPLPFSPVKDYFAPNSFFYLTDDQKLSKDSYERYNSGIAIGTTSEIKADYFVRKKIAYDEIILDSRQRRKFRIYDLSALEMSLHTMDNYIAVSSISDIRKKTPLGGPKKVDVQQHDYVIADKNTLSAAFGSQSFGSRTEADTYMASLVGTPSYDDYMVVQSSEI